MMRKIGSVSLGSLRDKEVNLRPASALFEHLENHRKRMADGHRRKRRQHLRVLRLVPLGSETIGRANNEPVAFDSQRLHRLQPSFECLFRQLGLRAVQKARPSFLSGEGHNAESCGKPRGAAKLRSRSGICNEMLKLELSLGGGYV